MNIDYNKNKDGLVPAIIQDKTTNCVLMLGYMNQEAVDLTNSSGNVHFFSRSKNRIWMKGETSGNILELHSIKADCDNDALLVKVSPLGPTCHKGDDTCWEEANEKNFLYELEDIIQERVSNPSSSSYVSTLFDKGIDKIAQKVGEEATELVIASKNTDNKLFIEESADLLFHFLLILQKKGFKINDVIKELKTRNK
jgi:phosphoribosyl-ATP pyrophosphohydrolase/phosphoribosyl-AMP cyclohydrolase